MNDDHPASVYGMALSTLSWNDERQSGGDIKNVKLRSVSSTGYNISYVLCNGDMCDMRDITVPFEPPLSSSSEVRPRLIEIHHQVLSPNVSWLVSDSITLTAFLILVLSTFGYCVIGEANIPSFVENLDIGGLDIVGIIDTIFGSTLSFATCVKWAWHAIVIPHIFEALVAVYWCTKILKLKTMATIQWAVLVFLVGWFIGSRLFKFVNLQSKSKEGKSKQG
mmetsp:Transcript_29510/g.41302  ORF Transcript_29510/g.41302 Transcript_29510/m.41302 type:complete len:222 (-) Transcript_29510:679-1344(-)